MWDLPRLGIIPLFSALAGGFFITEPPEKPHYTFITNSMFENFPNSFRHVIVVLSPTGLEKLWHFNLIWETLLHFWLIRHLRQTWLWISALKPRWFPERSGGHCPRGGVQQRQEFPTMSWCYCNRSKTVCGPHQASLLWAPTSLPPYLTSTGLAPWMGFSIHAPWMGFSIHPLRLFLPFKLAGSGKK